MNPFSKMLLWGQRGIESKSIPDWRMNHGKPPTNGSRECQRRLRQAQRQAEKHGVVPTRGV